jgi:ribosomal protein L29
MSAELIKKSEKDLIKELSLKRKALREFRFNMAGTKTRNIKEGREVKKDIARILTELRKREIKA